MPDQYGRVTGRDWLGMAGAISSVDTMRRGQEYLGMRQAGEKREATKFKQSQEDRTFDGFVKKNEGEYIANLTAGGFIDERGNPTDQWNSAASKNLSESTRESTATKKQDVGKKLEAQGNNALAHFTAIANVNSRLAGNSQSNQILTQTALGKGKKDFENIKTVMTTASGFYRQGDTAKALKMAKETLDNSVIRRTGEISDDKIHIVETVAGVKNKGPGLTYPEVEEFIKNYNMEEHATRFAADAQVGREMALKPPMRFKTPDGKTVLVKQTGTSFGVDYFFFNPDGSTLKNPPKNLERAYEKGWMPKDEKAAADLALTQAKTEKVQKETGEIGKPKPGKDEKPMTPDKAREKLFDIAKFKSSLNKTGGWNETIFELMAQKDTEFAKRALSINSSKKEVNDTIKELEDYYRGFLPKEEKGEEVDIEKQNAQDAIDQGIPLENVQRMYKLRTGKELEL